jgi:hypothetical protein
MIDSIRIRAADLAAFVAARQRTGGSAASPAAPLAFQDELAHAIALISVQPRIGAPPTTARTRQAYAIAAIRHGGRKSALLPLRLFPVGQKANFSGRSCEMNGYSYVQSRGGREIDMIVARAVRLHASFGGRGISFVVVEALPPGRCT